MPQKADKEKLARATAELEFYARKMAVLLHHLNAPEEIKEAWANILPAMSLKQMSELLDILEARYLDEQTSHIDEELKEELKTLAEEIKKRKSKNAR
ncbi:MAG: hypothetical protein PHU56_04325 [Candidatus Pacebacteria bacterium]|nr:hypothetical protein [Candidatus Paceibacterota bacterium]